MRRRKRNSSQREIELKRKSIYSHNCRGRSETKTCENCASVAKEINDMALNSEIFDISNKVIEDNDDEDIEESDICHDTEPLMREVDIAITNDTTIPVSSIIPEETSRVSRRFDSVRNLLEKARSILAMTRSRSKSIAGRQVKSNTSASSNIPCQVSKQSESEIVINSCQSSHSQNLHNSNKEGVAKSDNQHSSRSQSSPNTPLCKRKSRNRSFSPIR